ncbi:SPOR domain-containing protein [Paracidovorax sp. MALMAid1276]|uniref:SPOR domain-containing protein n=1 Tax=Paracidovorax sp. MALMAid1276 TaxID=3411631 RepID=UPI003B9D2231
MRATTDPADSLIPAMSLGSPSDTAMTALYRVALGPVNTDRYLPIFARFDATGRTTTSWNWAACLCTLNWMVFRQLWSAALVYVAAAEGLALLVFGLGRSFLQWPQGVEWGVLGAFALLAFAVPGLYGNALLHADIRRRIARALAASRTVPEACALLDQQASTRKRLTTVVLANGVLAAAAVLAYLVLPQAGLTPPAWEQRAVTVADAASAASAPASASSSAAATSDAGATASGLASASVSSAAPPSTAAGTASAPGAGPPPVAAPPTPAQAPASPAPKAAASAAAASPRPAAAAAPAASRAPAPSATAPSASQQRAATSAASPSSKASASAAPASPSKRPPPPAAAAPKASAEVPATVGSTPGYYINVGLFADEANARKAQARLLNEGLPAFRQELNSAGGRRIRVRTGPYDTRAQADAAAASIRAMGLDAVVFRQGR